MAQYKTGTVSVTNGSAVVTGSGTQWLSNVSPGDSFTVVGSGVLYDVAGVVSDTELSLGAPYQGPTATDQAYTLQRDFTAPDNIPEMSQGDIETATIFTRAMRRIQQRFHAAADAALIAQAGIYPDVAAGLAGTSNGQYFFVPDIEMVLYRNSSGSAQEVIRYATGTTIQAQVQQVESMRAETLTLTNAAAGHATTATQKAGEAQAFRDQAAQIAGLDTVEQAIDAALPTAPALVDGLRRSVEAASGGRMTVFYTIKGQPSYFVRQPKFNCEDIAPGGELGTGTHEAFIFDGVEDAEIWIGAYQASVVNGEAVSQPGVAPRVSVNYDQARAYCQAAGAGFDLMTVWDWAAVALWCMARGFEPRGNTNHGRHHDNRWETGTRQYGGAVGDSSGVGNILTGSGPAEWRHDGTMSGISDLVGNVWEWLSGMKMVDGRVFLSADNAIPSESGYVDTAFNMPSSRTWATIDNTGADVALRRALLVPKGVDDPVGYLYTTLTGERLPFRGGDRNNGASAGLGALLLYYARTDSYNSFGFRPRFRNP